MPLSTRWRRSSLRAGPGAAAMAPPAAPLWAPACPFWRALQPWRALGAAGAGFFWLAAAARTRPRPRRRASTPRAAARATAGSFCSYLDSCLATCSCRAPRCARTCAASRASATDADANANVAWCGGGGGGGGCARASPTQSQRPACCCSSYSGQFLFRFGQLLGHVLVPGAAVRAHVRGVARERHGRGRERERGVRCGGDGGGGGGCARAHTQLVVEHALQLRVHRVQARPRCCFYLCSC